MSYSRQQPPHGSGRPRYPPVQTSSPQHGYSEIRSPSSGSQQVSPMSPSSSGRPHPQSRIPRSPQAAHTYGAPRPQYQPHPNMHPAPRGVPPRPPPPNMRPNLPPKSGPPPMIPYVQQRIPPQYATPGYPQPQRNRLGPEPMLSSASRGMRDSRFASSVYSSGSTPKTSPDVPQMSTFSDRQAPVPRNPPVRPARPRASSYYEGNPFMEQIPENPEENPISARSRRGTGGSSELEGYHPEPTRVLSPLDSHPKGLGGILAANQPENPRDVALVRQASIGKRQKAALTDVRYSDHKSIMPSVHGDEQDDPSSNSDDARSIARSSDALGGLSDSAGSSNAPPTPVSQDAKSSTSHSDSSDQIPPVPTARPVGASWPLKTPVSPTGGNNLPLASSDDARSPVDKKGPMATVTDLDTKALPNPHRLAPLSPPQSRFSRDWRTHQRQESSEEEVLPPSSYKPAVVPQRNRSLKERVGDKAPPALDVGMVREAEARGSLTSLPGLLNRALQLASNLERGKTASRQSFYGHELLKDLGEKGKSTASLNTMTMNAKQFPFPGARGSTYSDRWPRAAPNQPSHLRKQSYNIYEKDPNFKHNHSGGKRPRRCCGVPLWLFFLLLIIALALIVAAIVLPIALIVIPNDRAKAPAAPAPIPGCESSHPCANGGLGVADQSGNCQCICTVSYSGSNCTNTNVPGSCGSIPATGLNDASIGSNLPAIINDAPQYQIPLNATSILTAFSAASLDCGDQNTLVNINSGTSSPTKTKRAARSQPQRRQQSAATAAGGLLIAGPSSPASAPSPTDTSSSSSPSSSPSSPSSSSTQYTDTNHLNFAKSAILWVLQTSQRLDYAVTASTKLQPIFNGLGSNGGSSSGNSSNLVAVDMGNGFLLDLVDFRVAGDGQTVGEGVGNP